MTPEMRRHYTMIYEGQALAIAGQNGSELGAAHARCCADGAMNALIRIEGAEAAAHFAFRLSDRVFAGVRTPTADVLLPAPLPASEPVVVETMVREKPKQLRFWTIFAVGWLCGFAFGVGVGSVAR